MLVFHTAQAHESLEKTIPKITIRWIDIIGSFQLLLPKKAWKHPNILLDDLFKHVADKVEGLYAHWFLGELGSNWSDVCADELAHYGKILEIPQQEDFLSFPHRKCEF